MRILLFASLALILSIGFTSCGGDDLPACIETISTEYQNAEGCAGQGDFTTWTFKGETVYCFDWADCPAGRFVEIYGADCELICELGGPQGLTLCDGTDWSTSAELIETILTR